MSVTPSSVEEQRHNLYLAGKTDLEIAAETGATRRAISKWRASRKLPLRTPPSKPTHTPPKTTPPTPPEPTHPITWQDRAACHGMNTDLWFPEKKDAGYQEARSICRTCTEQKACLDYILTIETRHTPRFGMWAALTPDERQTLARRKTRTPATP